MSLDMSALARSNSPASSDSSAPKTRLRGKEEPVRKDKDYRRYASSIERALSLFDNALQEWADYISFLSRLLKALQSHPPELFVVPHKVLVAKRLAQCMNPSLPSGVHQKALEVYNYIFELIKADGLAHDLPLYLPGIAPTLTFASLSVRPLFLSLIDKYITKLEPRAVRPALKAILLSLLPGLEEETSDDFEPTLRLINKFRNIGNESVGSDGVKHEGSHGHYFWQCLFLASITNPSRRLGVLAYLNRFLPELGATGNRTTESDVKDSDTSAVDSVILPEPGLLIRCFASGLSDDQVLVQRNFLELLVTHLPLNSPVLQRRITRDDLKRLVVAAVGVVTRRDMSLNRRLWAWLLGPKPVQDGRSQAASQAQTFSSPPSEPPLPALEAQENSQSLYFCGLGLDPLLSGLLEMVNQDVTSPIEKSRPFRIALSLMDRWEVGGPIVPDVFLPIIESVQAYEEIAPKSQFEDVFRSASAFFDGVESGVIFSKLVELIDWKSGDLEVDTSKVVHKLKLARFIIENFNLREEDMLLIHVPLLALSVLMKMKQIRTLNEKLSETDCSLVSSALMRVMHAITGLLTERAFSRKTPSEELLSTENDVAQPEPIGMLKMVHDFYEHSKRSLEIPLLPTPPESLGDLIVKEMYEQVTSALDCSQDVFPIPDQLHLLSAFLKKLPKSYLRRDKRLYLAAWNRLKNENKPSSASFSLISSITSAVASLYFMHSPGFYWTREDVCALTPALVGHLWQYLSPSSPKLHVEAVRCMWLLHSVSWPDHLIEASITTLMLAPQTSECSHLSSEEQAERFFVLWNHSQHGSYEVPPKQVVEPDHASTFYHSSMLERPLLIVLDLLSQISTKTSQSVLRWLQDLPSVDKVLRLLVVKVQGLFLRRSRTESVKAYVISPDDLNECDYLLRTLSNVLSSLSATGWATFLTTCALPTGNEQGSSVSAQEHSEVKSLQSRLLQLLLAIVSQETKYIKKVYDETQKLRQTALRIVQQLLRGPGAVELTEFGLEVVLIDKLSLALDRGSIIIQEAVIDTLLTLFRVTFEQAYTRRPITKSRHQRDGSRDHLSSASLLSLSSDKAEKPHELTLWPPPPQQLFDCLLKGLSAHNSRAVIDKWILLLRESLPLYSGSIFHNLIILVECLSKQIQLSYANLRVAFKSQENWPRDRSEHVTIALLSGLETCIITAHERLLAEEANIPPTKSADQPQSFFGNMVTGVFTSDANQARSTVVNNRLTVLLCFQDSVRLCFSLWSWGADEQSGPSDDIESLASFQYTSLRMRNRSRRILEHLFSVEALECLETLVELWTRSDHSTSALILTLINSLDGSRPKITIPSIFNAIYTRTNPNALDPNRKSAMTTNLTESQLAGFLVAYTKSLEDDVLDEIWSDCTTFLRDVLSNPFPHRQILPRLVEFAAILGTKMENTTFGDDRRMRKELGDALLRMLTAIFTSKPLGFSQDSGLMSRPSLDLDNSVGSHIGPEDILGILATSLPALITTLSEPDRISAAVTGISTNVIGPLFRSRLFPHNLNRNILILLEQMTKVPVATKLWKKDIGDAFNDPRFFSSPLDLVKTAWMRLIRQLVLVDKDRFPDLLARVAPPSTAGIMFGVGASAARLEADRRAQLNLRRMALLIASADADFFAGQFPILLQKLEDLLGATSSSSPSSATRAETFMLLRSLVLKNSTNALAPFWPLINTELQEAICAVPQRNPADLYNPYSLLQACKLLDVLLVISPDEFQLSQWLFVTDTTDAVYPPDRWEPTALADEVSHNFGDRSPSSTTSPGDTSEPAHGIKQPWLVSDWIRDAAKDELVDRVLQPFFDRLSIHAFESTYSMSRPDLQVCLDDLLADLFNESTMAQ